MRKKHILIMLIAIMFLFTKTTAIASAMEKSCDIPNDFTQKTDAFMEQNMSKYDIPGAAIVVVKDGSIVFQKEYGYADITKGETFQPNTTFRIASITKVFTATALMQLVEAGKVDLTEDISTYLPTLKITNKFSQPVTVENLLTHTSGIDSSVLAELSKTEESMPSGYLLDEMNKKNIQVVTKPGTHIEYCSYGVVLQGCIIEAVTGESCSDYIEKHLLQPLGMNDTMMSMESKNLTKGYTKIGDQRQESTLDGFFKLYPEGGLISSLDDMTHFMQMFLTHGTYDGKRILSSKLVDTMLSQQETYDAMLPGMCYGFSEYYDHGVRVVGHGGYAPDGMLSQLDIYPEEQMATFIILNQGSNHNVPDEFRSFLIQTMKLESMNLEATKSMKEDQKVDCSELTGTYRFSDYSKTTLCKGDAFGGIGEVSITKDKDGILLNGMDEFTGKSYAFHATAIDDLHYQIDESANILAFMIEDGHVSGMAMTQDSWHGYYAKLSTLETSAVQVPFLVGCIMLYVVCFFFLLIRGSIHIVKGLKNEPLIFYSNVLQGSVSFFNTGFLLYAMFRWGDRLRYRIPWDVKMNLFMPVLGSILLGIYTIIVFVAWKKKKIKPWKLAWNVLFLAVSILYFLLLNYWNLFGFCY